MGNIFQIAIVQPLLNALFIIVAALPSHDFGIAIIILTILIRIALFPVARKQIHSQKAMSAIQPEVNKLKEKYKGKPKELQVATMELYKEKEFNPFGSCLPLLIQMPFLIGLFYVFRKFQDSAILSLRNPDAILSQIYPWVESLDFVDAYVQSHEVVSTLFLGVIDLAKVGAPEGIFNIAAYYWPAIVLGLIAGALQFIQTKMLTPKKQSDDPAAKISSQMVYMFPLLTVGISLTFPAALPLYWITTTLFAIGQQYFSMRHDVEELEENSERKSSKKSKRISK